MTGGARMDAADHGLVIGKFYPPHLGHHLLIRTAAACCRRVSVVVMASRVESISLMDRVAWLTSVHVSEPHIHVAGIMDEHPVDLASDTIWAAHVALMRAALASIDAPPVTAVFTSEAYGEELARRFDAVHVAVDPDRRLVPTSGSAIRRNLIAGWEYLATPVRASLAYRVVVLGAESTGTTTLARDLAEYWASRSGSHRLTKWVPEFGRDYSIEKFAQARARAQLAGLPPPALENLAWGSSEFESVAGVQLQREDEAAAAGGPILICDTDAFATTVWHERYVGGRNPAVEEIAASRPHALYLLTHHDNVAYEQDGLRDGRHLREWMTERFIARLRETGRRFHILHGDRKQRLDASIARVEEGIAEAFVFSQPIGSVPPKG